MHIKLIGNKCSMCGSCYCYYNSTWLFSRSVLWSSFYRWGNWDLERLQDLSNHTVSEWAELSYNLGSGSYHFMLFYTKPPPSLSVLCPQQSKSGVSASSNLVEEVTLHPHCSHHLLARKCPVGHSKGPGGFVTILISSPNCSPHQWSPICLKLYLPPLVP